MTFIQIVPVELHEEVFVWEQMAWSACGLTGVNSPPKNFVFRIQNKFQLSGPIFRKVDDHPWDCHIPDEVYEQ